MATTGHDHVTPAAAAAAAGEDTPLRKGEQGAGTTAPDGWTNKVRAIFFSRLLPSSFTYLPT
jgi:hypothetical protein